eukprot:CAMPEP_0179151612 /NCGR_PEP_ID=MMETSP0796-20121207/73620_1 /TAXON_ID=73915 /ORGANISM="Pyrodinium bahamense, Strain pbaha01" /LENGTH=51 /DNA_ID=CAMNT_0020852729 /DNA_START=56 /DNA_END=207 /DNA_ORIENTATION=+
MALRAACLLYRATSKERLTSSTWSLAQGSGQQPCVLFVAGEENAALRNAAA